MGAGQKYPTIGDFHYVGLNIKGTPLMTIDKVIYDMVKAKAKSGNGGLQEITNPKYKAAFAKVFSTKARRFSNLKGENPQWWNTNKFTHIFDRSVYCHPGMALVTPHRSSTITGLHYNHPRYPVPVAFVNYHMISGIRSNKHPRKWRRSMSALHIKRTTKAVTKLVDAGWVVIGEGDTNLIHMPKFHPNQQWVFNSNIDKMWFIPSRAYGVRVLTKDTIYDNESFYNTDHPMLYAHFELYKK